MRDQRLNGEHKDQEHMNPEHTSSTQEMAAREFDQRLIRALEMAPELAIPSDFAARVASRMPVKQPISFKTTHYGQLAMWIGMVVLLAALLASTLHIAHNSTFGLTLQWTLCAQFVLLAVWLSTHRHSLR
jgi:hypothetical protein